MSVALFDTNIIIDHLKGKREATSLLRKCIEKDSILSLSLITKIELMCGMRSNEEEQIKRFLSEFQQISVTEEIAINAGIYMNKYYKSHGINIADAIIAGTARHLDSKLYTLNLKHYPMEDIIIIKPY